MLVKVFATIAFAASSMAMAVPRNMPSLNPSAADIQQHAAAANTTVSARHLARALFPRWDDKDPHRQDGKDDKDDKDGKKRRNRVRGVIEVFDQNKNDRLGFISKIPFDSFGEYTLTPKHEEALIVKFNEEEAERNPVNIRTLNGFPDFPHLGAAVGFASRSDDLSVGSANYLYFVGSNLTPVNSPPAAVGNSFTAATLIPEKSESAIWTVNEQGCVTANWVNTDGSHPHTSVVFAQGILVITGDVNTFINTFGGQEVNLSFKREKHCRKDQQKDGNQKDNDKKDGDWDQDDEDCDKDDNKDGKKDDGKDGKDGKQDNKDGNQNDHKDDGKQDGKNDDKDHKDDGRKDGKKDEKDCDDKDKDHKDGDQKDGKKDEKDCDDKDMKDGHKDGDQKDGKKDDKDCDDKDKKKDEDKDHKKEDGKDGQKHW